MVKRVGQNIQVAVEHYLTENNLAHEVKYYEWEFNLVMIPIQRWNFGKEWPK